MATESDLRDLLRDPDPAGGAAIDLDAVVRGARRRRRPRVVAAALGGALAATVVLTPIVAIGIPGLGGGSMATSDAALESAGGAEAPLDAPVEQAGGGRAGPECESAVEVAVDAMATVRLEVTAVDLDAGRVALALSNDSTERVTGVMNAVPRGALLRDGVVLAVATGGPEAGRLIDLDPGERMTFSAPLRFERCGGSPEPLPSGPAEVLVAVDLGLDGRDDVAEMVVASATVTLP